MYKQFSATVRAEREGPQSRVFMASSEKVNKPFASTASFVKVHVVIKKNTLMFSTDTFHNCIADLQPEDGFLKSKTETCLLPSVFWHMEKVDNNYKEQVCVYSNFINNGSIP